MTHLLILFPILIVLAATSYHFYRKDKSNIIPYYFLYFFAFWSVCTLLLGIIEVKKITGADKILLGSVIGVPFYYFAMASLARIPFKLWNKGKYLSVVISSIVALTGLFIATANYFTKIASAKIVNYELINNIFNILADIQFRTLSTILFLLPVGIFFLFEARKAITSTRVSLIIISIGIIAVAILEPVHILKKHLTLADIGTTAGFIIILFGILWPSLARNKNIENNI